MSEILTRCGNRCDLCLAYQPNIETHPENRQKLSDGWFKYFGFRIPADEICCAGCMTDGPRLDGDCPIRPCVLGKGIDNCSQCDDYVCEKFKQRMVTYEDIKQTVSEDIPEEDYRCFIQPYENKLRLDSIRSTSRQEKK